MMMYRVWSAVDRSPDASPVECQRRYIPVPSAAAGYEVIESLQDEQEALGTVGASQFGLEVRSKGGWVEWYDDGGLDVIERFGATIPEEELIPVGVGGAARSEATR